MGNGSMIPYPIPPPPPALRVGSSDTSMDGHGIKKSFQEMRWRGIAGEAEEDLKANEGMGVQETEANESLHVRSKNSNISLASAHISGDSFHFWQGETLERWAEEGEALPPKKRTTITYQSDEEEEEDKDLPPKKEKTEQDKALVLPLKKRSISLTYRYEEDEEEEVKVLPHKKRKRVYSYKCKDQQHEEDDGDKALPLKKRSRLHNTVEEKQDQQCEDQGIDEEKEHCMINKGDEREEQHDEEEKKEGKEGTEEANYIIEEESEKEEFADEEEMHEEKEHCMVEEDYEEEDMGTHKTDPMYCMINKGDHEREEQHDQEEKKEGKEGTEEANCIIEEESEKEEFVDEVEVNEEKEHYMVEEDNKEDMGTHKTDPMYMRNPSQYMTGKKSQDEDQHEEEEMGTQITNPITLIAIAASWLTKKEEDDGQLPMVELIGGMKVVTKPRSKGGRKPRTVYTPLITTDSVSEREGGEEEDLYSKVKRRQGRVARGSRCTRVNGKGWRCVKQTRVGYSLCDHHLERQVRLRSMSGLRRRVVWESEKRIVKVERVAPPPKHGAVWRRGRKEKKFRSLKSLYVETIAVTETN